MVSGSQEQAVDNDIPGDEAPDLVSRQEKAAIA